MDVISIRPERKAQLEQYAHRHGEDPAAVLENVLAEYLDREERDYSESVEAIRRGHEDVKAGRSRPAAELLKEVREKHGFPR